MDATRDGEPYKEARESAGSDRRSSTSLGGPYRRVRDKAPYTGQQWLKQVRITTTGATKGQILPGSSHNDGGHNRSAVRS